VRLYGMRRSPGGKREYGVGVQVGRWWTHGGLGAAQGGVVVAHSALAVVDLKEPRIDHLLIAG